MRSINVYKKYSYYFRKYGTFIKLKNIWLNRRERKSKDVHLKSFPYKFTIDPGNICNLACPCCQTGFKHPEMTKPKMLRLEGFHTAFDQVKEHALSVALYNFGEPFLNKKIFDMISYSTDSGVGTTLHSNFNHFSKTMAEKSITSGLTHIYLSIDGATQEIYKQYRVKGNIDKVLENLKIMIDTKREMNSKHPIITWKYLTFAHNEHEVEMASKMAAEIGVDNFEVYKGSPLPFDIVDEANYLNENPELIDDYVDDQCMSLWNSVYISSDGNVFPCSLAFRKEESFGNINDTPFEEIWNNEKYTNARKMFTTKMDKGSIPRPCSSCKYCLKLQPDNFEPIESVGNFKGI